MTTPEVPATVRLKTSLDHLSGPKRHQLHETAKLFHCEAIVYYVILFGSYARGAIHRFNPLRRWVARLCPSGLRLTSGRELRQSSISRRGS